MLRWLTAALGGLLIGGLGLAGTAAAHVTVDPTDAVAGGYARVVFRVPNERDTASTTKVEIQFPEAYPIAEVATMPVPGWKVQRVTRKLSQPIDRYGQQVDTVVSRLVWTPTARGNAIAPGTFQEFPVSLGPLPDAESLVFGALQTYSNGEVVRWTGQPATAGEEPEHPAAVLRLQDVAADGVATGEQVRNPPTPRGAAPAATTPLWLGVTGLIAGLAGLLLGGAAWLRNRPKPAGPAEPPPDDPDDEPPHPLVRRATPDQPY